MNEQEKNEFIPEVGQECQVFLHGGWVKRTVIGFDGGNIVIKDLDSDLMFSKYLCITDKEAVRQLKTEDQKDLEK